MATASMSPSPVPTAVADGNAITDCNAVTDCVAHRIAVADSDGPRCKSNRRLPNGEHFRLHAGCWNRHERRQRAFSDNLQADSSNSTSPNPSYAATFYLSNPGAFSVPGVVLAAETSVLTNSPSPLTSSILLARQFDYIDYTGRLTVNESFTCSLFDGQTLVGQGSGVTSGTNAGANSQADVQADCNGYYPSTTAGNGSGATFSIPARTIRTTRTR